MKPGEPAIAAHVTELNLHGCYVEMPNPLEKGAEATFKVYSDGKYFESQGVVVYSQPNLSMGVSFRNVNPHYLTILKRWLLESAHANFGRKD